MFRYDLVQLIVTLIVHTYKCADEHFSIITVDSILDGVRREFATRDLRGE